MIDRLCAFYLLANVLFPLTISAQSVAEDSILYRSAFSHTVAVYHQQLGDQSAIFNGRLYTGYAFTFKEGIPYFLSAEFRQESIVYDGIKFDDVPLLYDDLLEVIITKDKGYWVQLVNERVGSFNIANYHFIRIVVDSLERSLSGTGYYEVLYQGHSTVLKKSIKKIKEELSSTEGVLRSIEQTDRLYVKMGKAYFPVKNKKEMLTTFSDHRKEIQQFLRKNKLKFRKDKSNTLTRVTAYYDQLTK